MRYAVPAALVFLLGAGPLHAHGLLIPDDKSLPPLAMLYHRVNVTVEDQAAVTTVEQAFRNHTDRQLEATYIFPVPKGASVNKFSMWIGDNEASGELLPSDKARQIYTDIVRRTQDPALLEYMGNDLLRLRVFPVPPRSDQKVKMSFTAIARQDDGVVEYVYPLQTTSKPVTTLEDFSIKLSLKSQHPIQNIYSPTHAIDVVRSGDREASVDFRREEATLNKDFQLFWSVGSREIGVTTLAHRPVTSEDGYVLLLVSPQLEASKDKLVPRDVVLVLDTSGSMDGVKMEQAKRALKYCLEHLNPQDRFGLVAFATTVRSYRDELVPVSPDHVANAKRWVDGLKAGGGTALQPGLDAALAMRSSDDDRTFTVAFFSDGQPTIGEMKPEAILKRVGEKTRGNTRIFTFGVGDEVNAALLDKLADETRAVSTYVRPAEDIATKVASIYNKISHPVMANVRLSTSENVRLHEVYPPELPDLFHGSQLVVLARYTGQGSGAVKLSGTVGTEPQEFAYDVTFPIHTDEARDFVEHLWARRKVGYLLDQIRLNGEQKELIDEVTSLATKYGIATPYTSHLVVPDAPMPVVRGGEAIPGDVSRPGAPEEGARAARLAAPAPVPAGLAPPGAGLGGFGGGGPQPFARDGAGIRGGLGGGFAGRTPAGGPGFARGAGAPGGLGGLGGTAGGFPAMPQQSQAPKKVVEFAKENQAQPEQG
ncbi:MAG TPA: VIT domain-containing protein, partial [Gemmataceae bacterium]